MVFASIFLFHRPQGKASLGEPKSAVFSGRHPVRAKTSRPLRLCLPSEIHEVTAKHFTGAVQMLKY